jgi:hypothetical protein
MNVLQKNTEEKDIKNLSILLSDNRVCIKLVECYVEQSGVDSLDTYEQLLFASANNNDLVSTIMHFILLRIISKSTTAFKLLQMFCSSTDEIKTLTIENIKEIYKHKSDYHFYDKDMSILESNGLFYVNKVTCVASIETFVFLFIQSITSDTIEPQDALYIELMKIIRQKQIYVYRFDKKNVKFRSLKEIHMTDCIKKSIIDMHVLSEKYCMKHIKLNLYS